MVIVMYFSFVDFLNMSLFSCINIRQDKVFDIRSGLCEKAAVLLNRVDIFVSFHRHKIKLSKGGNIYIVNSHGRL